MSRTIKRRALVSIICAIVCMVSLILFYFFKPADTMNSKDFTSENQVLAVQLSSQPTYSYFDLTPQTGYMVLASPSGAVRAFRSGKMLSADPIWTTTGIFYGGEDSDFFTSDNGTKVLARDIKPQTEYARYPRDNGKGFMAFYGVGGTSEGYKQPVLIGDADKTESVDVRGGYMSMGACGDTLYAIAQTNHAPNLLDQAKAVYQKHTGVSDEALAKIEHFDVLVQVYPANDPQNPQVLESIPYDGSIKHAHKMYQRYNDSIYLLSFSEQQNEGHAVLEEWNLKEHTHRMIDVVNSDGSVIDMNAHDAGGEKGVLLGSKLYFVTRTGKVFSVDITTGKAEHLYTFEILPHKGRYPLFDVTPYAVYRLDDGENDDSTLDFTRYVFKTGEHEHLFNVDSLAEYRKDNARITGIAVNPKWEKSIEK